MSAARVAQLLPPQTTLLERALLAVAPAWDDLANVGGSLDATMPEAFKPWLIAEWELAQFSPYFATSDELLTEALPWLFERGTAAAIRRVLGWLGYSNVGIEEDGAFLQIDLGRQAPQVEIERIAHVVRASIPAHIRFYRVYFQFDLRPVRLDHGPALDSALLDNDSGVWVDVDSGVVRASFGSTYQGTVPVPPTLDIDGSITQIRASLLSYDDRALLDAWQLDSVILVDAYGGLSELFSGTCDLPPAFPPDAAPWSEGRIGLVAWTAPQPTLSGEAQRTGVAPVPLHPHRRWGGPWQKPWRASFQLSSTEET